MKRVTFAMAVAFLSTGCSHHYTLVCESDTSKAIAIEVVRLHSAGGPEQLFYTELTANDTICTYDGHVLAGSQVEARFHLKRNPADQTVYNLPPGRRVRLKLDRDDNRVVIEETIIDGDEDWEED